MGMGMEQSCVHIAAGHVGQPAGICSCGIVAGIEKGGCNRRQGDGELARCPHPKIGCARQGPGRGAWFSGPAGGGGGGAPSAATGVCSLAVWSRARGRDRRDLGTRTGGGGRSSTSAGGSMSGGGAGARSRSGLDRFTHSRMMPSMYSMSSPPVSFRLLKSPCGTALWPEGASRCSRGSSRGVPSNLVMSLCATTRMSSLLWRRKGATWGTATEPRLCSTSMQSNLASSSPRSGATCSAAAAPNPLRRRMAREQSFGSSR